MKLARSTLIADSGFLVALFDCRETHHVAAQSFIRHHPQPLVTVEALVVEVSLFLAGQQRRAFLNAVAGAALTVLPLDVHDFSIYRINVRKRFELVQWFASS